MPPRPAPQLGISAIAVHQPAWQLDNGWFGGAMPRKFAHHTGIEARGISLDDEITMGLHAVRRLKAATGCNLADCRGIALVSPYNSALDRESAGYWTSRGFEVVAEASAWRESSAFHPIYSLSAAAADTALAELEGLDVDVVLMLGTGMPTLRAIAGRPLVGTAPVLSCMLCVAWRAVSLIDPAQATPEALMDWVHARHWRAALDRMMPV